jgi:hypothetical protein
MLGVVKLHDLATDGRLKGAIVVCVAWLVSQVRVAGLEETRRTGQVRKSGLAAGEGGAGEGYTLGGRGSTGSES